MSWIENGDTPDFMGPSTSKCFKPSPGKPPDITKWLECDTAECGDLWGVHYDEGITPEQVDQSLLNDGWRFAEGGKHYCPVCTGAVAPEPARGN